MCKYIDILKREIKQIQLYLSANIIKNALGIGIPGTGKIGIEIAATLGGVIKKSEKKLEILFNFTKDELEKANEIADFNEIKFILNAVPMNKKVSTEGLKGGYGLQVGNKISSNSKFNLLTSNAANQIIVAMVAASDARMDGCTMPIMTTGGSGNQGIACTMPVIELGSILKKSEEDLARALIISNLITIHLKEYMGRLSPLCGAGIAEATGACCGMTYLQGGTLENIKRAINNMLADLSGLICDRAKTSCVLKIATATIQCSTSSNTIPSSKDGIVFDDVEETIKSIAKLVKEGLANTDNKEAKDT